MKAALLGPILCPKCNWNMERSHDGKTIYCVNGGDQGCEMYKVPFIAPTVELERADG